MKLYKIVKQKASKIQKKYFKNTEIYNTSVDSIRGFINYKVLKWILNNKRFSKIDYKQGILKLICVNTGIYIKINAKDSGIYIEIYAMSQYRQSYSEESLKELNKLAEKIQISSYDLAFDTTNRIEFQRLQGFRNFIFRDTQYFNHTNREVKSGILKVCMYNKTAKAKSNKKQQKILANAGAKIPCNLYRTEFTIIINRKRLNKNKMERYKPSKKQRFTAFNNKLATLIENININININNKTKQKNKVKILYKKKRIFKKKSVKIKYIKIIHKNRYTNKGFRSKYINTS